MTRNSIECPGLVCIACEVSFALKLPGLVGAIELRKLPDPFEATCPLCRQKTTYPLSAIVVLRDTECQ